MECGWIKLHRKIIDSDVFADPMLFKLWCLCLLKANHKESHYKIDGVNMPVKMSPGQFITGRYELHKEFYPRKRKKNKSAITLWRKLQILENMDILNIKSYTKYSIISILNWNKYQQTEQRLNNNCTTAEQQLNTDKNDKKNKEELFTQFWIQYNKKLDRKKCSTAFLRLKQAQISKIFETLPDYIKSTPDTKYRKNPLTYLNGESWNDEIPQEKVLPLFKKAF